MYLVTTTLPTSPNGQADITISKLQASLPIIIPNCTKCSANRNKENNVNTNHRRVLELLI